jgi:hypothetical protein
MVHHAVDFSCGYQIAKVVIAERQSRRNHTGQRHSQDQIKDKISPLSLEKTALEPKTLPRKPMHAANQAREVEIKVAR